MAQRNPTPGQSTANNQTTNNGLNYEGRVILVFQGGGALGAYQVGVYEALHHVGVEPDWIIGTSIGAINAALIAGNAPEHRLERLNEFWHMVQSGIPDMPLDNMQAMMRLFMNAGIMLKGVPGFFKGNFVTQLNQLAMVGPYEAGYYDTSPLAATLARLVDFKRINSPTQTRLSLGAVNVLSGNMRYFDNRVDTIGVENIMASGALPPAFPAVQVEGEPWWDGGIYSNTPVEAVMNDIPRHDSLIFAINLWHSEGEAPQNLLQAVARSKDIQFASRADNYVEAERKLHNLRRVIRKMGDLLPEEMRNTSEIQDLLSCGCRTTMHLVRMNAPHLGGEDASKDIDFSHKGIEQRKQAGFDDMMRVLKLRKWEKAHDALDGIVVHD